MQLLIISDIHANMIAYRQFQRKLSQMALTYDKIVCLGDIFGYYPQPIKTWQAFKQIMEQPDFRAGNHDVALARWEEDDLMDLNDTALITLAVQHRLLQDEDATAFQAMKAALNHDDRQKIYVDTDDASYEYIYIHGRPDGYLWNDENAASVDANSYKSHYLYPDKRSPSHIFRAMQFMDSRYYQRQTAQAITFFGHTHMPMLAFILRDMIYYLDVAYTMPDVDKPFLIKTLIAEQYPDIDYRQVHTIFVNPGSIGQPRDGVGRFDTANARSHAVWIDTETQEMRFLCIPYAYNRIISELNARKPSSILTDIDKQRLYHRLQQFYRQSHHPVLSQDLFMMSGLNTIFGDDNAIRLFLRTATLQTNGVQQQFDRILDALWSTKITIELQNHLSQEVNTKRKNANYSYEYLIDGFHRQDNDTPH